MSIHSQSCGLEEFEDTKITKGSSQSVNRRRTDNTIAIKRDRQRSTKHTHTKLKTGDERM